MHSAKNEYQLPEEVIAALRPRPTHGPKMLASVRTSKYDTGFSQDSTNTSKSYRTLPKISIQVDYSDIQEKVDIRPTSNGKLAQKATGGRLEKHRNSHSSFDLLNGRVTQFDSGSLFRRSTDEKPVVSDDPSCAGRRTRC